MQLSSEQKKCLDERGERCVVKACCGAGKTRVLVGAAMQDPTTTALIVSFNRSLAEETAFKVKAHPHIVVSTIHGLASSVYGTSVPDNRTLCELIETNAPMNTPDGPPLNSIGLLCIDEIQDVFAVHIRFLAAFVRWQLRAPQLLLVGDSAQELYRFMHGDEPSLFERYKLLDDRKWNTMELTKTQRLTPEMTALINRCFRGPDDPPLVSAKPPSGRLPELVVGVDRELLRTVDRLLEEFGPANLMVVSYTLKAAWAAVVEGHLIDKKVAVHNTMSPRTQNTPVPIHL